MAKQVTAARIRARKTPAPSPKVDKLAYSINDLHALGFGCRAYIYGEINAGRLRATKRGRYTVILGRDLDAWVASLPAIKPRNAMPAE